MTAIEAANLTQKNLLMNITSAKARKTAFPLEKHKFMRSLIFNLRKALRLDYSSDVMFKPGEKEELISLMQQCFDGHKIDPTTHQLELLAWHMADLPLMPMPDNPEGTILEFEPSALSVSSEIEKVFRLFYRKGLEHKRTVMGLMITYLDKYKKASKRYAKELKKYMQFVGFSKDLDFFFNYEDAVTYVYAKTLKYNNLPFPERLMKLDLRIGILETQYIADLWYDWMFKRANLCEEEYVLKNMNCRQLQKCSQAKIKLLAAKAINANADKGNDQYTQKVCLSYIFPCLKNGNCFTQEFWTVENMPKTQTVLDKCWRVIQHNFVQNEKFSDLVAKAGMSL